MTVQQILAALESMGLAGNRELYARHGITPPAYGVAFGHLRAMAKQIGTDAAMADALWATGNHDARILATLVAGEKGRTVARLRAWAATLDNYVIADLLARWASHSKAAPALSAEWTLATDEWIARGGWMLRALLAIDRPELPDRSFAPAIPVIEREIHSAKNRVRDAMNTALIAIAIGRPSLTQKAIEAARRIGPVEVDYGESGAVLAPAEETIRRGVEQRHRRESGRAGGMKAARRKREAVKDGAVTERGVAKGAETARKSGAIKKSGATKKRSVAKKRPAAKKTTRRGPR
jgi:3-methyladenine DNA glycosylase AlkD